MWKPNTAVRQSAMTLRYLSDLTDAEWALVELMIPSGRHMADRKRSVNVREVLNGIFYVLWTRWKALPKDLPE
jgi:transposase